MAISATSDAEDRLRWIVNETLVIAGILGVWIVVGVAVHLLLGIVSALLAMGRIEHLRGLYMLLREPALVWSTVTPFALLTVLLYVTVRAGTILLEEYRSK